MGLYCIRVMGLCLAVSPRCTRRPKGAGTAWWRRSTFADIAALRVRELRFLHRSCWKRTTSMVRQVINSQYINRSVGFVAQTTTATTVAPLMFLQFFCCVFDLKSLRPGEVFRRVVDRISGIQSTRLNAGRTPNANSPEVGFVSLNLIRSCKYQGS